MEQGPLGCRGCTEPVRGKAGVEGVWREQEDVTISDPPQGGGHFGSSLSQSPQPSAEEGTLEAPQLKAGSCRKGVGCGFLEFQFLGS